MSIKKVLNRMIQDLFHFKGKFYLNNSFLGMSSCNGSTKSF